MRVERQQTQGELEFSQAVDEALPAAVDVGDPTEGELHLGHGGVGADPVGRRRVGGDPGQHRLLRTTLDELDALRSVTAEELAADAIRRAATERLLQVVVDLAVDINAHIAVTINDAAPATARQSFAAGNSRRT